MTNNNNIAITIRMLITDNNPAIATLNSSEQATTLAADKALFTAAAEKAGIGTAIYFESAPDADAVKAAATANLPAVIAVRDTGIFGLGLNGAAATAAADSLLAGSAMPETSSHQYRLSGCIAAVTGSAQGFGKGIVENLAKHGACIVVADINDELGTTFVSELNSEYGKGTAIFCHADVTSLDSLDACTSAAVDAFGGLDMFVANAGILKAGPIEEMDERSFDLVTNINYKAYFLCVKATAPIMKLQNKLNPNHFMDIVQINSKSGLQGSNKNFTYAGSKFGTLGLTQSFAMELIPYNIKVNSVCPGNFFEGPLWSDPGNGLFVQYLEAGKVPGAKTLDDVKEFYLSKVPMHRGCSPADVTTAILYAHDQKYETGQAIPVTGGQVMLK